MRKLRLSKYLIQQLEPRTLVLLVHVFLLNQRKNFKQHTPLSLRPLPKT